MAMKKPHHDVSTREERTYVDRLEYCSISCIHIQWKWNTVNKFNNAYLEVGTEDSSFFVGNCTGEWGANPKSESLKNRKHLYSSSISFR
jgi:hypothetical protein